VYLGATLALSGAAVFYRAFALWIFAAGFLLVTHVFVVAYEEPALRQTFGEDYPEYCRQVRRWIPRVTG
jgi:protein-S-isoprenylcysteine O-methyltransferase Ste14